MAPGERLKDGAGATSTPSRPRPLADHLGEDVGRLVGLLDLLEGVHGTGFPPVTADQVEPFLGEAGGVAPWDLTDAIDKGDTEAALDPPAPHDGAAGAIRW